ncbi:MAG: ATP-dependent Clp protease ATP-binding subunit, partial [Clostridia bacterium]|nr:ATP-dependent Clp protease ATP-binding subunit [Clostridia bacterium]
MTNRFTEKAQNALQVAMEGASAFGHTYIGSEHLLLGLCADGDSTSAKLLHQVGVDYHKVQQSIEEYAGVGSRTSLSPEDMTPRTKRIIELSAALAARFVVNQMQIGTAHLLLALLGEGDSVAVKLLYSYGVKQNELKAKIVGLLTGSGKVEKEGTKSQKNKTSPENNALKDLPNLSNYGRDLTAMAREGKIDPIIGRDGETARVIQILCRRQKNNPCLIGEPGVGKTAVVEGLAQKIAQGQVPDILKGKIIVALDIASMIAGTKYRGEFEERMKGTMDEVRKNPQIILFIDEIHTIVGAGAAEGAVDAANILKPALARGEMQVIGATTIGEYRKHIEKDAALERR